MTIGCTVYVDSNLPNRSKCRRTINTLRDLPRTCAHGPIVVVALNWELEDAVGGQVCIELLNEVALNGLCLGQQPWWVCSARSACASFASLAVREQLASVSMCVFAHFCSPAT